MGLKYSLSHVHSYHTRVSYIGGIYVISMKTHILLRSYEIIATKYVQSTDSHTYFTVVIIIHHTGQYEITNEHYILSTNISRHIHKILIWILDC